MAAVETLITDHLDLWTAALKRKATAGRGSSSKVELYGINKLRELILELAVRGLLVPQDPNDEPASELLRKIAAEKAKLLKEGKIKKDKPLPSITEDEKAFKLPEGWHWAKLGMLMEMFNGRAFSQTEWSSDGLPIIRIQNLNDKNAPFNYFNGDVSENNYVEPGTFLISWSGTPGTSFGAFVWSGAPGVLNQHINKCIIFGDEINKQYLRLAVNGCMDHLIESAQGGVGLKHVTKGTLNNCVVAIPPLAEQHRIVAKVDELMALCYQLEQETEASLGAHQTLVETLLSALTSAADHAQFASAWQRIAGHFDTLFTTEESIAQLKQTILQLAVMGKLVPQDPNDEPASELLKKIAAEKAKLVKEGKIKKEKPLPPIESEEKIFELPTGWSYCRLDEICLGVTSGSTPPQSEFSENSGVPYLKVYNIRNQAIDFEYKRQFISEQYSATKLKKSILYPGDVVMNIVGPPLGKVAIIPGSYPQWNCNQAIVFFRPAFLSLGNFIYTYLKAGLFLKNIELIGTAGQDNISVTKSRSIALPMPPLNEQHRIVAKVDELTALCDQLKSRLSDAQTTQLHLADALVEQAIG